MGRAWAEGLGGGGLGLGRAWAVEGEHLSVSERKKDSIVSSAVRFTTSERAATPHGTTRACSERGVNRRCE